MTLVRLTMPIIILFLLITSITRLQAQVADERGKTHAAFAIAGQLMVSGNNENLFLNFGGGGLTMRVKASVASINFLPSLRYNFATEKISPTLGFGPQWYFKNKLIIGMPLYYLEGNWKASFGIGYKLPVNKG